VDKFVKIISGSLPVSRIKSLNMKGVAITPRDNIIVIIDPGIYLRTLSTLFRDKINIENDHGINIADIYKNSANINTFLDKRKPAYRKQIIANIQNNIETM
jgi:hypothetical protein